MYETESCHFLMNPDLLDQQFREIKKTFPPDSANLLSLMYEQKYLAYRRKCAIGTVPNEILRQEDLLDIAVKVKSHGDWRHKMKLWSNSKERICLEYKRCRHVYIRKR